MGGFDNEWIKNISPNLTLSSNLEESTDIESTVKIQKVRNGWSLFISFEANIRNILIRHPKPLGSSNYGW